MSGIDILRKLSRLTIFTGLLIGLCDPASAYDPKASQVSLNTSGFDNNLDGTVNDVQELADAVDELSTSTPETDPVVKAISGIVKSNGTTISAAVSSTDYAPATSGTAILKGNGSGGFSSASAGSDYLASETDGVIGNEITSATDGSLTRSGSGTGGSPYTLALNVSNANTWTGQQTFNTSAPVFGTMTAGSTYFAGAGGLLSQDNQNYHFNDALDRLSIYNTLGSEVVTNGTFASNANSWTVPSGMAYSSSSVSKTSNGTGALVQSVSVHAQREYLLTYVISNWTVGTITPSVGSFTGTAVSANGTYSERFIAPTTTASLSFTPSNTARFTIDTISIKPFKGTNTASNLNVGGFGIQGEWSNGSPGTTRGFTYSNDGSYSWTDYRFAGLLRVATGANSSGGYDIYQSGGNGVGFYQGNSGLTSNSLYMYATSTALVHYGYGEFYGGLIAGSIQQPTSTLQTEGGLGLNVKRITASQSLDNTATHWLIDATTAAACTGTASTACSTYNNSTDCGLRSSHGGGCSWNPGSDCSAFNSEYGMGTCTGTSGCTSETGNCSGGDESTCLAGDDSYGGNCSWGGNDCSLLDEGTCGSYSGSGCSQNYSDCSTYNDNYSGCTGQAGCSSSSGTDCSAYDGTDQGTCEGNGGCYWDGMSNCYMTCSGTYYTGCSGTYYTCTGTYYTGSCTGTYGAACSGTPSCAGLGNSTDCGNETGCTWSSVLNATLPDGETCPDRTYWIYNDSSGGADVVLIPYSGQTVNETTSYTLGAYRDWIHVAYYKQTKDCSLYLTEGACTPTGCSPSYSACSWDGMTDCSGAAACDAGDNTDSMTCTAITYFSSCSGTEVIRKNWYKMGS